MNEKETKHASKFLSLVLRHEPERVGFNDNFQILLRKQETGPTANDNQE